ncbi:unnamed protein product [Cylindrotheca closterium]|uniref:Uncharacterized protein n=1 Tax=Cylindrotheca closterium TaxID=2856 RepID=A0AAD2FDT9_9STRA|nr:unnamed protein product [Cylindrotheca closterium]
MQSYPNVHFKDNIIERMGGSSSLNMLVVSFCENIKDDPSLAQYFGNFAFKDLSVLEEELLMAALVESEGENDIQSRRSRVALRHFRLFESGLNEHHFDRISKHLKYALEDCWAPEDVIQDCGRHFAGLRPLFEHQ